jgi:hypothetical protein
VITEQDGHTLEANNNYTFVSVRAGFMILMKLYKKTKPEVIFCKHVLMEEDFIYEFVHGQGVAVNRSNDELILA